MYKRFLEGFITFFPFLTTDDKLIKYFPEEIYRNDWRNIGNALKTILRNKQKDYEQH